MLSHCFNSCIQIAHLLLTCIIVAKSNSVNIYFAKSAKKLLQNLT
nr:MAG TPA: hypothetical protein [Caudoviricetes sp.]